jgi:hypothetical protein
MMKERGRPLIIALRLKVVNGRITEIEHVLVFSFPMFQHRGGSGTIKIYNVPGVESLPLGGSSSNLQAAEIFKIDRGRITAVEGDGRVAALWNEERMGRVAAVSGHALPSRAHAVSIWPLQHNAAHHARNGRICEVLIRWRRI